MTATAWGRGPYQSVEGTIVQESQTATSGQTVFTLRTFTYSPNTNSILVFKNGVSLASGVGYTETDSTKITLAFAAIAGDVIFFVGFPKLALVTSSVQAQLDAYKAKLLSNAAGDGASQIGLQGGGVVQDFTSSATGKGAALIVYIRQITGAVPRSVNDSLQVAAVTIEELGGVGDGVTDDTNAIEKALQSGFSINVTSGKTFLLKRRLTWASSYVTLGGGGKIKLAADFDVSAGNLMAINVTGAGVTIDDVVFDATGAPPGSAVENGFIWCTNAGLTVTSKARFIGMPKGTCIWCLASAPFLKVVGAWFNNCRAAVFSKGRGTVIANNVIVNAYDAAIAINGTSCVGSSVTGNVIMNDNLTALPSMIAIEEGASDWSITGNVMIGANGGGIFATNVLDTTVVRGGVISGNIVSGSNFAGTIPSNTNPSALLYISPYYTDCIVKNNILYDCPTGNASSRLMIVSATGHTIANNIIDSTGTAGLSAACELRAGSKGLSIRHNTSRAAASGRHFLFAAGDYGNVPCSFAGGKFYGGSEGINSELNAASITNFKLYIKDIEDNSTTSITNAATAIGDRSAFLNAGAWARPHNIGVFTNMYANAVAANAGAIAYQTGDTFYYLAPAASGFIGYTRVPGAWKGFGAVSA